MNKERLVAFSDGVIAVVITIMVLEFKAPEGASLSALRETVGTFASYLLSFLYVAIYWNNHHHLLHITKKVDGRVMWANLNLLFWLSLIPFSTRWLDEQGPQEVPVVLYGTSLLLSGAAYYTLQRALIRLHGNDSALARALTGDFKSILSLILYVIAIAIASVAGRPAISLAIYFAVALLWFIPDRRIEAVLDAD